MREPFLKEILAVLVSAILLASTSIEPSKADNARTFTNPRNQKKPQCQKPVNICAFTRMIVFGDSLSDVGNLPALTFLTPNKIPGLVIPPPPRYDRGHFSNGPVAVEYLAEKYQLRLQPSLTGFGPTDSVSFAYGGSTTGVSNLTPGNFSVWGLLGQVNCYINFLNGTDKVSQESCYTTSPNETGEARPDLSTLFVVWSGANDYILPLSSEVSTTSIDIDPHHIVENIKTAILKLYAHGAYYFLVPNLPNLGKIPLCLEFQICDKLSTLARAHNTLLKQTLTDIEATQNDIELIRFDTYQLFERILAHPEKYGFSENVQDIGPAGGCLLQDPATFDPAKCDLVNFNTDQVFWDEEHPTTKAHQIWAQGMWEAIWLELLRFPWPQQPLG